jgi:transaldolase
MNMTSKLEQLRNYTTVVADTGDIEAIGQWQPEDATTNPSLLLKAASLPQYQAFLSEAVSYAKENTPDGTPHASLATDYLAVKIGKEILDIIPGKISTEVDARLSFDTAATVDKAIQLIALYEKLGVSKDRVLIKIASTWEGIKASEILEKQGIRCNLTLLFSFAQARAAADAGAFLISPFVGRILDWYKNSSGKEAYLPHEDPGVLSVTRIFNYYKSHGYNTVVMGASFRNIGEIEQLAGCDRLTISPDLLKQLSESNEDLPRKLSGTDTILDKEPAFDEQGFRWALNEDPMATEKLAEGIRKFAVDQIALEQLITEHSV